jgi:hypothetical protein
VKIRTPGRLYAGVVRGGKLRLENDSRRRLDADLSKREGKRVYIEVHSEAQLRSLRQNAYWWVCVLPAVGKCWQSVTSDELPLDVHTIHEALVPLLLGKVDTPHGKRRRSTSGLTVEEFGRLIDQTAEYLLTRYQCVLPSPDRWEES